MCCVCARVVYLQGLAAAAAAGDITISQLLQYSAVCGCGLDTVPVPGPAAAAATADGGGDGKKEQQQQLTAAAAQAQDALTTAAIAGLISDVNTLAHRCVSMCECVCVCLGAVAAAAECVGAVCCGSCIAYVHARLLMKIQPVCFCSCSCCCGLLLFLLSCGLLCRLNKPLACRLLPLPGKVAGQPTGFVDHPYMINSSVMDLHK